MNLVFKDEETCNKQMIMLEDKYFCVSERCCQSPQLCEEYGIIKKIIENKEGYFDFNKNLIDIGAEDGNYAMLTNFHENYIFEPNKKMCCIINTNMYLKNKVDNSFVYNIALSSKDDYIMFDGFSIKNGGFYKQAGINLYEEDRKTPTTTLDSFNIKNVGLIKIDVEGMEYDVLKGSLKTIILNNYPPILFESWPVGHCHQTQEQRDVVFNLLKLLGYEILENWGDHETHLAVRK